VIPTRNEAASLPAVLRAVSMLDVVTEVVIVDGASIDGTVEVARRELPAAVIVLQRGVGKGGALRQGIAAASGDVVVTFDGDGSADADEIPRFVEALVAGADLAKGSRTLPGGGSDDFTPFRRLGNRYLTLLVNALFGVRYTDLCYGYNAFWHCHASTLLPHTDGFEVEAVTAVRAVQGGLRVVEVPSRELPRTFGTSKLHPVRDGLVIQAAIIREWRQARRLRHLVGPGAGRGSLVEVDESVAASVSVAGS
jgi:glycosyltransferase involved in cell wall biosynthesis